MFQRATGTYHLLKRCVHSDNARVVVPKLIHLQCHLTEMNSDTIRLHLSPSRKAFAIDYFVHPVRHDGSCPRKEPGSRTHFFFTNTTLIVHTLGVSPS